MCTEWMIESGDHRMGSRTTARLPVQVKTFTITVDQLTPITLYSSRKTTALLSRHGSCLYVAIHTSQTTIANTVAARNDAPQI